MRSKVRVLVVDDSALVRQTLAEVLSSDPGIEVVATASDPYFAARKMSKLYPDVITLDIEMPRMDGLTFLKKIMSQKPLPVVICSAQTGEGSEAAMRALELGAVEVIHKPKLGTKKFIEESRLLICDAVKAAAQAKLGKLKQQPFMEVDPKLTADAVLPKSSSRVHHQTEKIIVVGASTGGTEAIKVFLESLPDDAPGVVIVQHMPEHFTGAFARRLDGICRMSVREAKNGDPVVPGRALIAPGNHHMLLKRTSSHYEVEINDGPLVCRHRPSVDVLFRSAAKYAGKNAIGIIMTGMGDDGARGLKEMKEAGAFTIAQNEATSVVFGMPNEAIKRGAADLVLPLQKIGREVLNLCEVNPGQTKGVAEAALRGNL